jgi:hypothetical protein
MPYMYVFRDNEEKLPKVIYRDFCDFSILVSRDICDFGLFLFSVCATSRFKHLATLLLPVTQSAPTPTLRPGKRC